jgi:hypothetical protein
MRTRDLTRMFLAALTAAACGEGAPEPRVTPPPPVIPEPEPLTPEVDADALADTLGVDCAARAPELDGATHAIDFTVPAGAESALFVPLAADGTLELLAIDTPTARLDVTLDYRHHNIRLEALEGGPLATDLAVYGRYSFDWPILLPYAPAYRDRVVPGAYVAHVAASAQADPCHYVATRAASDPGAVSLNLYFVGLPELDAASAPDDPDLTAVLARVDELLTPAGVSLGAVRHFDLQDELAQRYTVIRDGEALQTLTAQGIGQRGGLEANMSVDVFFVRSVSMNGAVGLSGGLPGAPGMHGNPLNGLVFGTSDLGVDNDYVAHIMAHELGHYLGLRHTTEIVRGLGTQIETEFETFLGTEDPLADTVACDDPLVLAYDCPDATNLMFPAAPAPGTQVDAVLSEEQGQVLRWNPLVR